MFDYFKGILIDIKTPYCVVEVNGIGYRFLVNSRTISKFPELNNEIKMYAKLIHREDSMTLCGFLYKKDKIIFDILTGVSGIGIKAGMMLLDEFETDELVEAVIKEDYKTISRTKGIGPKMAQKIVLELKDKLTKLEFATNIAISDINNSNISADTISQTITVLESLGYSKEEYKKPLDTALSGLKKDDPQELLSCVLKILSVF